MAMESKKGTKEGKDIKFEVALNQLEGIVQQMENAELPLEELIERYEEGMRLVKVCSAKLADAEQKVEVLTRQQPDNTGKGTDVPGSGGELEDGNARKPVKNKKEDDFF